MSTTVESCVRCGTTDAPADPTLNSLIAAFSAERQKLQAVSDSIVYPVLTLPPEITAFIFLHCLPEITTFPQPSPLVAPLLLTQICRQWRDIAIASSELWQSIGIVDTRAVDVFDTWLLRSRNHPLNLSLNCVDHERGAPLVDVCISHTHRWRNVELALPVGLLRRLKLPLSMPLLCKISLSLRGPFVREQSDDDPISLSNAPILCEADLSTHTDLRVKLPWAQLATLRLDKADVAESLAILELCPNLVTLDLSTVGPPPATRDSEPEPLILPNLQSFTFSTDFCPTLAADGTYTARLQNLLAHCVSPIQQLSLALKYPASETLQRTLDAVPASLHALELHCGNATHLAPLLAALHSPDVLPALTTLTIAGGRVFDDDYDALPALLQTRAPTLREFSMLMLTYGRVDAVRDVPLRMRALPKLNALAEAGMKIRVTITARFHIGTEVLMDTLT
ncbi:hypothetical protein B0H14DRAFT_2899451 [Mycena olivaceomarginata]|nr:hypothetical protein B0H14DRAFT_2899451 [Mycena olivaceomarginata]